MDSHTIVWMHGKPLSFFCHMQPTQFSSLSESETEKGREGGRWGGAGGRKEERREGGTTGEALASKMTFHSELLCVRHTPSRRSEAWRNGERAGPSSMPASHPHHHTAMGPHYTITSFCFHETLLTIKGIIKGMHARVENVGRVKSIIRQGRRFRIPHPEPTNVNTLLYYQSRIYLITLQIFIEIYLALF